MIWRTLRTICESKKTGFCASALVLTVALGFHETSHAEAIDRLWPILLATEKAELVVLPSGAKVEGLGARPARIRIVVFWASWCPYCQKALQAYGKLSMSKKPGELDVVAISIEDDEKAASAYVKSLLGKNSVARSPEVLYAFNRGATIRKKAEIPGLPTTVIMDGHGKVLAVYTGFGKTVLSYVQKRIFRELTYGSED